MTGWFDQKHITMYWL